MSKIKPFSIERLHNEEDFGLQERIKIEAAHLKLEADQEMVRIYLAALLNYDLALKSSISNSHTAEVQHINSLLDDAWRGLHLQTKVALKHPNEAYCTTATESERILHKYGDITNMGYNEKSGCTHNILQDFNVLGEEKQKQISIYDWVVELQTRYNEFMLATTARIEEDSHHIIDLIKNMRNKADGAFHALVERVNALALVNGEAAYRSFTENVNVIIDEANAVLAARKTRAQHSKESNTDGNVEV